MQYSSKGLPHLIPTLVLIAPKNSEIIVVSPWMENVLLNSPPIGGANYKTRRKKMHLCELIEYAIEKHGKSFTLVVREIDHRIRAIVRGVKKSERLTVHTVSNLHAKLLITDDRVIQTSANFIRTSLYRNVESCSVFENKYGSARQYLSLVLGIYL